MNRLSLLLVSAVLIAGGACRGADGPPAIEVDRTMCAHCGMFVSETVYAAAYRTPGGETRVFDDLACLRAAARAEPDRDALTIWFRDAGRDSWIPASEAVLVRAPRMQTPMGGGLMAYSSQGAALDAARTHDGEIVASWTEWLWGQTGGAR